jgi:hypothetical protein
MTSPVRPADPVRPDPLHPVGPRGISVLIFFAFVALALALIGWFSRNTGVPPLPNFSSLTAVHLVVRGMTG